MDTNQDNAAAFASAAEVAKILGLSVSSVNRFRLYEPESSPPFARIGKRVVYPLTGPNGLYAWIDRRAATR